MLRTSAAEAAWRRPAQLAEIELAAALVNLHRIAAAHGDMRLGIAFEIRKIATRAGATIRIARNSNGLKFSIPDVAGDQAAMQRFCFSSQNFG